ncbi:MAG: ABC transporter ATP-binding protein [Ruminococcaceae bacterium]|nr:ABC transporter ATP-binding protein [Oscillospiraceae bacterium]
MAKINRFHQDEELKIKFGKKEWGIVFKYVKKYWWELLLTIFVIAIGVLSSTIVPYIMKIVFDDAIVNENYQLLYTCGGFLATMVLVNILVSRFRMKHLIKVGQSIIFDIRTDLFAHIQKLPFVFFDTRPHGKILIRVTNYINSLAELFSNIIANAVLDVFSLVAVVSFMFAINVKLTLVALCGIPVLLIVMHLIKKVQRKIRRTFNDKNSNLTAYLMESINGVRVTQAFGRRRKNERIFTDLSVQVYRHWMKTVGIEFMIPLSTSLLSELTACVTYFAAVMVISGEAITVGVTISIINYLRRLWNPINNLSNLYNQLITNMSYLERILETLEEPEEIKDSPDAYELPDIKGEIEYSDVDFLYDEDKGYVLKDLNFHINPGERIAFVGQTGAGKTTIVNLLSRYYEIQSGNIRIDGHDIRDITMHSLRRQVGYMLQESYIFSGTIMENIRYGRLDATDEEVIAAAKAVCAHDFIIRMKDGYHTQVSEKGSSLSIGQRQLISLARTMLLNPKILVLDEATANIDTETEQLIIEGIKHLMEGRTTLMIAHRLSTIVGSDRILVIGDTNVVEEGTHEELLAKQGAYYNYYTKQTEQ